MGEISISQGPSVHQDNSLLLSVRLYRYKIVSVDSLSQYFIVKSKIEGSFRTTRTSFTFINGAIFKIVSPTSRWEKSSKVKGLLCLLPNPDVWTWSTSNREWMRANLKIYKHTSGYYHDVWEDLIKWVIGLVLIFISELNTHWFIA